MDLRSTRPPHQGPRERPRDSVVSAPLALVQAPPRQFPRVAAVHGDQGLGRGPRGPRPQTQLGQPQSPFA
eukprot:6063724-Lingulodinium_polyedra.AAC.1